MATSAKEKYIIYTPVHTQTLKKYAAYMKISFSLQILRKPSQKCSTNVEMECSKAIWLRLHRHSTKIH